MKSVISIAIGILVSLFLVSGCSVEEESKTQTALEDAAPAQDPAQDHVSPDPVQEALDALTAGQENAIEAALGYLESGSFSRKGLLSQLTSEYGEQFPANDAEFALSFIEKHDAVDWRHEAVESAKSYLESGSFSRQGLIDQLTSESGEQFSLKNAEYAVDQTGL